MSVAANQQRTFRRLIARLRPHWRRDPALPARIHTLLAAHREFGSRDRKLYRELIYTTLRYLPWIEPLLDEQPEEAVRRVAALAAESPATKHFRAEFGTGGAPVADKTELLPAWFRTHCPELFVGDELEMQLRRAPLWLRLQTDNAGERGVLDEFKTHGWAFRRSAVLPDAVELLTEADITKTHAWEEGRLEIQDLGSQLVLASIGIEPGETWLDACAGAGGKSLQLAHLLGPSGHVNAHDVRPAALAELHARASRAGLRCHALDDKPAPSVPSPEPNAPHPLDGREFAPISVSARVPVGVYDGVLVDAPCSGSGTWRRAPHLKWVTKETQIAQFAEKQTLLLHAFSKCVKPGGRLVYATCSLSRWENENVIAAFVAAHPEFETAPFAHSFGGLERGGGLTLFPSVHDTDGFFVASLWRR